MSEEFFPVLGKGERITGAVSLSSGFGKKYEIRDFESAKERLIPQLEDLARSASDIPEKHRIKNGVYFCVDMDSSYVAKSYFPHSTVSAARWDLMGSIAWNQKHRDGIKINEKQSRRLYFRGSPDSITFFKNSLEYPAGLTKTIQKEVLRIDSVKLINPEKKLERLQEIHDNTLVELIIHSMSQSDWDECLWKLKDILLSNEYPEFLFDWVRSSSTKSPRFLPAQVNHNTLNLLSEFNPLRSIRVMPGISFPRIDDNSLLDIGPVPKGGTFRTGEVPEIGVFDGGVDTTIPHLGLWVVPEDLTPAAEDVDGVKHGTAVCGAVLYGPYDPNISYSKPSIQVKSFRIFPVPTVKGIHLDLYKILDWIEQAVENNPKIKTFVLSFGPDYPIEDDEIDPFTETLDRLAYEKDVLFVVAAGNKGKHAPPFNRIQPPSDIINGIGVGAYVQDQDGSMLPASYSCAGSGRCGNAIKPDVHAFGGGEGQLFNVFLAGGSGKCAGVTGTSFAAPVISSLAGHLLHRVDDHTVVTPQTAKALLIHNAKRCETWDPNYGWGAVPHLPEDIMKCTDQAVSVIYNGEIDFTKCVRLKIPFFEDAVSGGYVTFRWTFVFATGIAPSMPDEYSLAGAEISFRPHSDVFTFSLKGNNPNSKKANLITQADRVKAYIAEGRKQSTHASTRPPKRNEQQRREEGIWDTVEHCWTKMRVSGVKHPCLDIHALSRSDWEYGPESPGKIKYAAIVNVEFSRNDAKLYQLIRDRIPELVPVRLRTEARVRVT